MFILNFSRLSLGLFEIPGGVDLAGDICLTAFTIPFKKDKLASEGKEEEAGTEGKTKPQVSCLFALSLFAH